MKNVAYENNMTFEQSPLEILFLLKLIFLEQRYICNHVTRSCTQGGPLRLQYSKLASPNSLQILTNKMPYAQNKLIQKWQLFNLLCMCLIDEFKDGGSYLKHNLIKHCFDSLLNGYLNSCIQQVFKYTYITCPLNLII